MPMDLEDSGSHEGVAAGMISTNCSPVQVAEDAIQDARAICMRQYGHAPDVTVYGDPNFTFAYVPSHLNHMVFELVKNCLRAQNDHYEDADVESPPVAVSLWQRVTRTSPSRYAARLA